MIISHLCDDIITWKITNELIPKSMIFRYPRAFYKILKIWFKFLALQKLLKLPPSLPTGTLHEIYKHPVAVEKVLSLGKYKRWIKLSF